MSEAFTELADSMLESMRAYCDDRIAQATREQPCSLCAEMREQYEAMHERYLQLDKRIALIPAGDPGMDGERGEQGAQGERGMPGQDGRDGRDGLDGERGRDALELHVLDGIDPTRAYKRGTWACHDGGLVSALRSTDPLEQAGDIEVAGWAVRVRGLSMFKLAQSELRSAVLTIARTAEKPTEHVIQVPGMIPRGLWKAGDYVLGDCVQYSNHSWVCTAQCTSAMPGASPDWTILARKGADGNKGRDGERGERGPQGEPYSTRIRELGVPT